MGICGDMMSVRKKLSMFTFFYIFVYTYTCNDMRSVMLQINEYDDDDQVAQRKPTVKHATS